jgi:Concanavalin A-like lectin/glucanases superfamily
VTTVTGLTADRMLAIEAASVVDGDVVGDNLILTKHDGSQINAGSVRGPAGPQGPVGTMLPVINNVPILDTGLVNQIRAGRQLSAADFGNMSLSAPIALWNLSDLSDSSGNGHALLNKGAVPFTIGINGAANTAALFNGSVGQALYIPDGGAGDPFRIRTGSIGCWVRSPKKGTTQTIMSRWALNSAFTLQIVNEVAWCTANDGTNSYAPPGLAVITDNRWHFVVVTFDGTFMNLYVDSVLENRAPFATFSGLASEVNIGNQNANASSNGVNPLFGCVDEAFITADVLSEDQVRNLYCARISHTLGSVPFRSIVNVKRRRRGAALSAADFPTQPLRLYNFSAGSLGDEGSNAVALTANPGAGVITPAAGADGSLGNAYSFSAQHNGLSGTDAGLPSALATRSYGAWIKIVNLTAQLQSIIAWGTLPANRDIFFTGGGALCSVTGNDQITGPFVLDGLWHFGVVVVDNGEINGIKRKLYLDGALVSNSTVVGSLTPAGANRFRVGADADGTLPFPGQIDGAFVCNYALTAEQIAQLYVKSFVTLATSPKNPGDHIEAMSSTDLLVAFDSLEPQHTIDIGVAP